MNRRHWIGGAVAFGGGVAGQLGMAQTAHPLPGYNRRTAKMPRHVLQPSSEAELAGAIRMLAQQARGFSVLSSGSCFAGLSHHADTVVDLRALSAVRVDPVRQRLFAGPAATLEQVNRATAALGLALPAGYCQSVALGGHVCGGGIGIVSRRFGLACDHLHSARVALASGQIVTATQTGAHADLLWALKGGGSGYGIVSEFALDLVQAPDLTIRTWVAFLELNTVSHWLADWFQWSRTAARDLGVQLWIWRNAEGQLGVYERVISAGGPGALHSALEARSGFGALPGAVGTVEVFSESYHQMVDHIWPPGQAPSDHMKMGAELIAAPPGAMALETVLATLAEGPGDERYLALELLGGAIDDPAPEVAAYPHRGRATWIAQVTATRKTGVPFGQTIARLARLQASLRPSATGGSYINYPEPERPQGVRAYFGANTERLRGIKTRYDPGNLFSHALTVTPL